MSSFRHSSFLFCALMLGITLQAQESGSTNNLSSSGVSKAGATANAATAPLLMATDPGYRLSLGDEIAISVHGEDDISTAQRIDKKGTVRIPYVNEINLADKTVREAEGFIEQVLIERKLLKKPLVTITVRDYASYEVSFTGSGVQPGVYRLPREVASIEIVELITRYGGLKPTAKAHDVKVYRKDETGTEKVFRVDYEAMQAGKKNAEKSFLIYPGDRIYVEDRLF